MGIGFLNNLYRRHPMKTLHPGLLALVALTLLLGLASSVMAEETKARFKSALADKETFVVTEQDKDHTFKLGANAKILIDDRQVTLGDLKAGDNVTVTWQERDGQKVASMVACKR